MIGEDFCELFKVGLVFSQQCFKSTFPKVRDWGGFLFLIEIPTEIVWYKVIHDFRLVFHL